MQDTLGIYAQYKVYDEMKRAGVKVSLDGQGADEIFAGYGTYRAIIMRENFFNISFWKSFLFQDVHLFLKNFILKSFLIKNKHLFQVKKVLFMILNKKLLNDVFYDM